MDPKDLPAFPITEANGANDGLPGMALRDYFAGLALQAIIAADGTFCLGTRAQDAYAAADAMLAAR